LFKANEHIYYDRLSSVKSIEKDLQLKVQNSKIQKNCTQGSPLFLVKTSYKGSPVCNVCTRIRRHCTGIVISTAAF